MPEGAEQDPKTGVEPGQPPAGNPPAGTAQETVSKAEHQRELDRYRNEMGQLKKQLQEMTDSQKSDAEKLAEKAKRADELEPEVKTLREALAAEVDARKKTLPEELASLLPEGSAAQQLEWIRKATAAAEKLGKGNPALPPAGGRNPATGAAVDDKTAFEAAQKRFPALRGREFVG